MNNLEFDHADIFDDLEAIQRQFHHLVRTVPGNGLIISPLSDGNLHDVLEMGCWTPLQHFDTELEADWHVADCAPDGSSFDVICETHNVGTLQWSLSGRHNISNALAALAAARHAGVPPSVGIEALARFENVKRRMELRGEVGGVRVFDDFAHHPTAIRTTLDGLSQQVGNRRILAILEPRSNTMRMGVHVGQLADALGQADQVWVLAPPELGWDAATVLRSLGRRLHVHDSTQSIIDEVAGLSAPGDQVLIMSNGGFEGIHQRLLDALDSRG